MAEDNEVSSPKITILSLSPKLGPSEGKKSR
jgi:hypothetical protein